jgi:Nucleotidyl transferase of unknown function (DUF2204)
VEEALLHTPDDTGAGEMYRSVVWYLREAGIPYLVGGTYALEHHAGVVRDTKDLDLFVRRADWSRVTETLGVQGMQSELVFTHWLGKVKDNGYFVDIIFAGGNGLVEVDDEWLAHGVPSVVIDVPVHLVPPEEMIWSKAFVMERERYDGADVLHILRKSARELDWSRLLRRFAPHPGVLLSHLVLFEFVYPDHRELIPEWVMEQLWKRTRVRDAVPRNVCRGTLVSRQQYLIDVTSWGYHDAREMPQGRMTAQQIHDWTEAIDDEK